MRAHKHKDEVIGTFAQVHTSPFSSHGYELDVLQGNVQPSLSYAYVVGGHSPTFEEEVPWWEMPEYQRVKECEVCSDPDSECPSLEECDEDFSSPPSPELSFGLPLGWLLEARFPEEEKCEIIVLYEELSIIEDSIAMFERFPSEARGDMADMYLQRLRLQDKIRHLTPLPPPRLVEISDSVTVFEDSDYDSESSVTVEPVKPGRSYKYFLKNARRRIVRKMQRMSRLDDLAYLDLIIEIQSGVEVISAEITVPKRITNRTKREEIQRAKAQLRKKEELRSAYNKAKSKTATQRRKNDRAFKYDIEQQSGVLSRSYAVAKSLISIPATIAGVNDLVSATVEQVNSPDSEIQRVISHSVAAVIKLGVVAEQASNTIEDVANSAFTTFHNVDIAAETVANAAATVPEAASAAKSTFEGITDIVVTLRNTLLEKVPAYLVNSLMAGFLYYVLTQVKSPLLRAMIVGMTSILFAGRTKILLDEVFKGVLELKDHILGSEPFIEQQSGAGVFPLLAKVVGTVLVGSFLSSQVSADTKTSFEKHLVGSIGAVPRVYKGIESVMEVVVEMAEKGINLIRAYVELPPIKFSLKLGHEVANLAKEVYEFEYKCDNKSTGMKAVVQHTHIMGLMHKVETQLNIHSANREIRDMLRSLKSILLRLVHPIKHVAGKDIGFRPQPASVIIAGKPGIGKTLMTQTIALTIMKLCGAIAAGATAEEASQAVFVKPYNSAFMDGYNGQFAYLIDDLFAIKPNPNAEANSFADIMTYYGCYTAMLNMADCEMKGMYPFTSRLILMTTNCRELNQACASQILLDESAFRRRIDFHVELVVRKEYRVPGSHMLDSDKFTQEVMKARGNKGTLDRYPWHIWEYFDTEFDAMASAPETGGKPLKDLLIAIAAKIKQNEYYHENSMDMLNDIVNADVDDSWISQQSGESMAFTRSPAELLDRMLECEPPDDLKPNADCPVIHKTWYFCDSDEDFENSAILWLNECYDRDKDNWSWYVKHVQFHRELRKLDEFKNTETPVPVRMKTTMEDVAKEILKFSNKCFKAIQGSYNICPKLVKNATFVGVAAVATVGVAALLKWVIKMIRVSYEWVRDLIFGVPEVELQSNGPKPKAREIRFLQQQAGGEVFGAWYSVYRNTYKMAIVLPSGDFCVLGQVTFLRKNLAMLPYHFLVDIKNKLSAGEISESTLIELRSCSSKTVYKVLVSVRDLFSYDQYLKKERDLAFVNFDNALRPHKDIIKFFLKSSEIRDIGGYAVRLDTARMDKDGVLLDFNERVTYISPTVEVGKSTLKIGDTYHKKWLRYFADTRSGDCGAILSLTDTTAFSCRFVAGIHIGYDPVWKRAYSTPVDCEVCQEADTFLKVGEYNEGVVAQSGWSTYGVSSLEIDELPFTDGKSGGFGSFEPLLKVFPSAPLPISSQLRPTPFKETEFFSEEIASFYDGRSPEKLVVMKMGSYKDAEGNIVFPMLKALEPYAGTIRIIDKTKWRQAMDIFLQPFNTASRHFMARTLSFEEAVEGCPAIGLKSIERKSSVGYPCSLQTGNRDKSWYFGKEENYDLTGERALDLKNDIDCLLVLLRAGVRPYFVCRDFLKDEVRKEGKEARLISGTDIRFYILCRMYFGAWVAAMTKLHNVSGACLGMNQYTEWDWLKQHILKPGDKVWDGDFAGFDTSQQPSMLWPILDHINEWYALRGGAEDNEVRKLLFYDIAHSRHLVAAGGNADTVVQWNKSMASGNFLTADINSVVSGTAVVSGFVATTGETDFWTHAAVAVLGDDNICCASDKYIGKFNQVTLSQHLKEAYGLTYTAGRKGEALKEYMGIEDIIFLQRRFAVKYGQTVCPIRPESFLNSLYYTRKGSDVYKKSVIVDGLENALQELSMHTEEQWNRVAPRIVQALAMYDEVPQFGVENSRAYFDLVRSRVPEYL